MHTSAVERRSSQCNNTFWNYVPYTDALLALWCVLGYAILLDGLKNWLSRQIHCPFLPDTSSLPWCKRGKVVSEGARSASEYVYFGCFMGNVIWGPATVLKLLSIWKKRLQIGFFHSSFYPLRLKETAALSGWFQTPNVAWTLIGTRFYLHLWKDVLWSMFWDFKVTSKKLLCQP